MFAHLVIGCVAKGGGSAGSREDPRREAEGHRVVEAASGAHMKAGEEEAEVRRERTEEGTSSLAEEPTLERGKKSGESQPRKLGSQ